MHIHLKGASKILLYGLLLLVFITACQQTSTPSEQTSNKIQINDNVAISIRDISPDVLADTQRFRPDNPIIKAALGLNLLANPSFENGANAWVACNSNSVISSSTDAISEDGFSLSVETGCMYQDVIVRPGNVYTLSCQAKLLETTGWSGMGFGFMDSNFAAITQGPENQITTTEWLEYSSSFTAPEESAYVSVWFYTDSSVLIDDCSFSTSTTAAPDPDPETLIQNGSFDGQNNWYNCGNAAAYSIAAGQLNMNGTACIFQTVEATPGADYRLRCDSRADTNIYSSITLSMLSSTWAPLTSKSKTINSNTIAPIEIAQKAPDAAKHVAITFYGEGTTTHKGCFLTINTVADPVSPPDGSLFPYPNTHPSDNEAALANNNLLVNPTFANQTGWTNCAANSAIISGGNLDIKPGVCFFQQINAEVGKTYSLSCRGSMDLPLYSVITLNMLDINYQSLETKVQPINTQNRQWRVSSEAPENATYVTVGFYTETAANYNYCYLSTETPPAPIAEEIFAPVKAMELLVPIYIDPAQDLTPWNQVIATAQTVPTTVVVNPVIGDIEGCQEVEFTAMLGNLQRNKVDTIGYIPTGYTATPPSVVKERIDRFKDCLGIDGVFFDEIKVSNQAEAEYYEDICDYAKKAYGDGKFVVNAGTNIQIPITNEFCNIALIYEFYGKDWKDFSVFGYQGAETDATTSIMIHTSNGIDEMKKNVDLAYSRKIDYVFVTDDTVPNPWTTMGSYWTEFVDYVAQKNAPFN